MKRIALVSFAFVALTVSLGSLAACASPDDAQAPDEARSSSTSAMKEADCEGELSICHHGCFSEYCGDQCEEKYERCAAAEDARHSRHSCDDDHQDDCE